jgi:Galactosyltransferase/Bacterial protein of unknown function (HtrL_YibB)
MTIPTFNFLTLLKSGLIVLVLWILASTRLHLFNFSNHSSEGNCGLVNNIVCRESFLTAVTYIRDISKHKKKNSFRYKFCECQKSTQDILGDYLNSMGCANLAGADFIAGKPTWPAVPYFSVFPLVVLHASPILPLERSSSIVKAKCRSCQNSCWEDQNAPWRHILPFIRKHLQYAAELHSQNYNRTTLNILTDKVTSGFSSILPVIPDVTVQYECSDSTTQTLDLLFFKTIRDLIPGDSQHIYIISPAPKRKDITLKYSKCRVITTAFYDYIVTSFPCATVVLKRSGEPYIDFSRYTLSPLTICSSSSSCFWPAIASKNTVYLPPTVTMGGASLISHADLGSSVRYHSTSPTPFKPLSTASDIVGVLRQEDSIGSRSTTVVTGYYRVSSKYDHGTYDKWVAIFMAMNFSVIIYCDEDSKEHLERNYPATLYRIYVLRPISAFTTSDWDWESDELLDPEINVGHSALLYKIWNEKVFSLSDAAEKNVFKTETFAWVDIGCFRDMAMIKNFNGFPDNTKFDHDKVTFLQIKPFTEIEKVNVGNIDNRFISVDRIGGGIFGGGKNAILRFRSIFRSIISEAKESKVFAGKDQSLFAFSILRNPDLFSTVDPITARYDNWMILHLMWASSGKSTRTTCVKRENVRKRDRVTDVIPQKQKLHANVSDKKGTAVTEGERGYTINDDNKVMNASLTEKEKVSEAESESEKWYSLGNRTGIELTQNQPVVRSEVTTTSATTSAAAAVTAIARPSPRRLMSTNIPESGSSSGTILGLGPRSNSWGNITGVCDVMFLIVSTPTGHSRGFRDAIRNGWLSDISRLALPILFEYRFVVGREKSNRVTVEGRSEIEEEDKMHDDMVVLPVIDTPLNKTLKVLVMLKWPTIINTCKYIIKVDDNVHIRAKKLSTVLRTLPPNEKIYGGEIHAQKKDSGLSRYSGFVFKSSRVSNTPYAGAAVYIMSNAVAVGLPYILVEVGREYVPSVYLIRPLPKIFSIENVYIGNMISATSSSTHTANNKDSNRIKDSNNNNKDKNNKKHNDNKNNDINNDNKNSINANTTLWHIPFFLSSATQYKPSAVAIYGISDPNTIFRGRDIYGSGQRRV